MPRKTTAGAIVALAIIVGAAIGWHLLSSTEIVALGKPLPAFDLEAVEGLDRPGFSSTAYEGQVRIINAFASWCGPCRAEHPLLVELAARDDIALLGMNVTDLPENATAFLAEMGNPYDAVGADPHKQGATRLGMIGLPHTLIIDAEGRLLLSHPGPLSRKFIDRDLPEILASHTIQ